MEWLESILLGLVQGLTEFLPVSSSGHLVLVQELLGFEPGAGIVFEVAVHVATVFAILVFYRKRVGVLAYGAMTAKPEALRYMGKLAVGTLPAIAVGLLAKEFIEAQFESATVVATMLIVTGFIVWSTRYTIGRGEANEPTWIQALLIGCAQAFAILPGISRSGSTVATAMVLGLSPLAAAEFSFLLGVIAICGAAVLLLPDIASADSSLVASILIGSAAALLSGLAALATFVWLLKSRRFYVFAVYAWLVGGGVLIWASLH